jgi:hypothetical protein
VIDELGKANKMKATTRLSRCAAMVLLVAACGSALAAAPEEPQLVWVENPSFGFDACAGNGPSTEQAAAALSALRTRAITDLENALRARGVELSAERFMVLTPVSGALACSGVEGQVVFRVTAVDRRARSALTLDVPVRTEADAADRTVRVRLANALARHFGSTSTRSAML